MRFYKAKIILIASVLLLGLFSSPASAVVNGEEILDADVTKPWVAQIYWAETLANYSTPSFICSGSLISEDKILTAAHCVFNTGFYFVSLGARTLNSTPKLLEVNAVWRNPRYSDQRLVNDVGLLKLTNPVTYITPIPLASNSMSTKINKLKSYRIYGWGKDQNGVLANYLRTAAISNQDAVAKKYLSKIGYSSTTMLAAGNYIKSEKIYAGACKGDSGGPLVTEINGVETLIGITSWVIPGQYDTCDLGYPSVFTRVTYFLKDINAGLTTVKQSSVDNNRAAPSVIEEPKIIGVAVFGSTITCDKGRWSDNTTNVTVSWSENGTIYNATSLTLTNAYSPRTFQCTVTGKNSSGEIKRVLTIVQPTTPTKPSTPYPSISGISSYSNTTVGTVAQCSASSYSSDTVMSYQWGYGTSYSASSLSNPLGSGSTLTITQSVLDAVKGKYLICQATATNSAGSSSGYATQSVTGPTVSATPTPTPTSTSTPSGDCVPHPMVGVCANEPKLISSRVDEGVNFTSYFHTILVTCIGDKSLVTQATLQFSGPYAPIAFTCGIEKEYGGFSSSIREVTASITANNYTKQSPTHTLSQNAPITYTSAATLPVIKSVSITGLSLGQEVISSTVFTCTVNLSNTNFSYITYTWQNSNSLIPYTSQFPHKETVFVSSYKSTTTSNDFAVSGEGNLPLLKGLYLECIATVYRISDGRTVVSSTKIKIP